MYRLLTYLCILYTAESASYQPRYESSTYAYQTPSTIANLYNSAYNVRYQDTNFPEATRYPSYNPTNKFNPTQQPSFGLNTGSTYGTKYGATYGSNYGSNSYGSNYGTYGSQAYGRGYSAYEQPFMRDIRDYCVNRSPQNGIWVDSLMGMWYGVEFIQHLAGDSRVDYARTCIVIHIAEPVDQYMTHVPEADPYSHLHLTNPRPEEPSTENQLYHVQHINAKFRQEYRHLRLLWDEAGLTTEYSLYFRNDSAGYWQVFNGQNGTLTTLRDYQQFGGSIQVLKAVNDHLVLNFCQEAINGRPAQLYTVLFSRDPGQMARWELESVHTMLQNKKLSVASRRMVCGNNAGRPLYSLVLSIFLVSVSYAIAA